MGIAVAAPAEVEEQPRLLLAEEPIDDRRDVGHLEGHIEADLLQAVRDSFRDFLASGQKAGDAPQRQFELALGESCFSERDLRRLEVESILRLLLRSINRAVGDMADGYLTGASD